MRGWLEKEVAEQVDGSLGMSDQDGKQVTQQGKARECVMIYWSNYDEFSYLY